MKHRPETKEERQLRCKHTYDLNSYEERTSSFYCRFCNKPLPMSEAASDHEQAKKVKR